MEEEEERFRKQPIYCPACGSRLVYLEPVGVSKKFQYEWYGCCASFAYGCPNSDCDNLWGVTIGAHPQMDAIILLEFYRLDWGYKSYLKNRKKEVSATVSFKIKEALDNIARERDSNTSKIIAKALKMYVKMEAKKKGISQLKQKVHNFLEEDTE